MKSIINFFLTIILRLRYKVEIKGLESIQKDGRPMLFLPNHPALIDPVIVMNSLLGPFNPRPLADEGQVDKMFIRHLMKIIQAIIIPDPITSGRGGKKRIEDGLRKIAKSLDQGNSVLLYPAGRLARKNREELGANSGVEYILGRNQNVRVILIRSTGLWGSSFSRANGRPLLINNLSRKILYLLLNGLFFMPKRKVTLEIVEPVDFPYQGNRETINTYLENFYNKVMDQNSHVPYLFWKGSKPQIIPEKSEQELIRDTSEIPFSTVSIVKEKIEDLSGEKNVQNHDKLAQDLGMDSLVLVEFAAWLEEEFAVQASSLEGLITVADCILAAGGIMPQVTFSLSKPVSEKWLKDDNSDKLIFPDCATIQEAFLQMAKKHPDQVVISDQISGEKTYRQIIMSILAILPEFEKVKEERIGILLPASVSAVITYLAVLFAGKEPVMVNWTTGPANMDYCLKGTGVKTVITAGVLLAKLNEQGLNFDDFDVNWIQLEKLAASLSKIRKIKALLGSRFSWQKLSQSQGSEIAAILFTSGSEAKPKSVPLSHVNFIANGRDFFETLSLKKSDRLLGVLPVFHSLGLAGTVIMPLCTGLKTVYHANPTEGAQIAKIIDTYKVTTFITTPTFLNGVLRSSGDEELQTLRIIFSGAEKCPDHVFKDLALQCPEAILCEGYGVTECSPVISVNHPDKPVAGTIGRVLPSMEYRLIHPETKEQAGVNEVGQLLVRGPNVFNGYLGDEKSPFVTYENSEWYDTGDLVLDKGGLLSFAGRRKRFVKIGGEMISLPAIEHVLEKVYPSEDGPMLAIMPIHEEEHPELVLMTTSNIERSGANRAIRENGLSPLHNIRTVLNVPEIPVLGTGKTDYRSLKEMLIASDVL